MRMTFCIIDAAALRTAGRMLTVTISGTAASLTTNGTDTDVGLRTKLATLMRANDVVALEGSTFVLILTDLLPFTAALQDSEATPLLEPMRVFSADMPFVRFRYNATGNNAQYIHSSRTKSFF